jgi:hypothetical protein
MSFWWAGKQDSRKRTLRQMAHFLEVCQDGGPGEDEKHQKPPQHPKSKADPWRYPK